MLQRNLATLSDYGADWSTLRNDAREQLVEDALKYTSAYRDVDWARQLIASRPANTLSIVMAGHQPTLFHPGVWFKNFSLSRIGQQSGSLAINLVIDNDVASAGSIRVPTIRDRPNEIVLSSVSYDKSGGGVPFEQTTVRDRNLFDHFDRSVCVQIEPLVQNPCVEQLWQHARNAIERCGVAGCALAQARHGLESDIGLRTLELPMSVVCRGAAFARFVFRILCDLPRFHDAYNSSAHVYRRAHGIRSNAHPVPDLHQASDEDGNVWLETPLWVYGNDSPTRKPVWAKIQGHNLIIGDRGQRSFEIDTRDPETAISQIVDAASPDFKLRPRALLTTMFARCVLSDLFLHGIGGGKYDQLGDMITQSFFQVRPTEFMVISATVQLPGIETRDFDQEIRRVQRRLRETVFQPEKFADQVSLDAELMSRKAQLLSHLPPRGAKRSWHQELTRINETLSLSLINIRLSLRNELRNLRLAKESQSRLSSRELSFCLFPLDYLVRTFESLLDGSLRSYGDALASGDKDLTNQ